MSLCIAFAILKFFCHWFFCGTRFISVKKRGAKDAVYVKDFLAMSKAGYLNTAVSAEWMHANGGTDTQR